MGAEKLDSSTFGLDGFDLGTVTEDGHRLHKKGDSIGIQLQSGVLLTLSGSTLSVDWGSSDSLTLSTKPGEAGFTAEWKSVLNQANEDFKSGERTLDNLFSKAASSDVSNEVSTNPKKGVKSVGNSEASKVVKSL